MLFDNSGLHHGFKLRLIELDNLLLLAMNPTRENHEEELPVLVQRIYIMRLGGLIGRFDHPVGL